MTAPTDFSGAPIVMPDIGHNVIYVKLFNPNTGSGDLITFTRTNDPPAAHPANSAVQYATAEALDALANEQRAMRAEIENLKKVRKGVNEDGV